MKTRPRPLTPRRRASFVVEAAAAYGVLMILAIYFLKSAISITSGQRWTIVQAMTDAFMTQESAIANRMPIDDLKSAASLFPTHPTVSTVTVTVGRLPGGAPITATLKRTKRPDPNNLPSAGGSGTATTNPASMEAWKLQSMLVYTVRSQTYVKTRTTVRVR